MGNQRLGLGHVQLVGISGTLADFARLAGRFSSCFPGPNPMSHPEKCRIVTPLGRFCITLDIVSTHLAGILPAEQTSLNTKAVLIAIVTDSVG
jgi:hypothetical protein